MRADDLYLNDIVEAAEAIALFVEGKEADAFRESDLLRGAVIHKLSVIGEAAARVSDDLKKSTPEVPWAQIAGLRNILVHEYFVIDWDVVWEAARERCPQLRAQVLRLIALP